MAQNLRDYYAQAQTEPVLTTVGRGVRPAVDALQERDQIKKTLPVIAGALVNQAPKVLGVPAAGIANVVSRGVADFQTGFTGQKYNPQQFEAKSFTDLFGGPKLAAPAAAVAPVVATTATPATAKPAPARAGYVPGTGLPSAEQIASDKSRANAAQARSDALLGIASQPQPTSINVTRQPNGVLSFSGSGGGDGTGAVSYSGMPNWTSANGGAGQGAVGSGFNLAEQNQRMFATLQGIQAFDDQKNARAMIDAMASGTGGAVGVARNKAAMAALGPLIDRQMAGDTAVKTTGMTTEAQKRGQDLGLQGDLARVMASTYAADVGAKTAEKGFEVDKQKAAAAIQEARERAKAGKPPSLKDQTALFVFSGLNADGTKRTPAQQAALELRYAATFGNRDSYMGMLQGEEE